TLRIAKVAHEWVDDDELKVRALPNCVCKGRDRLQGEAVVLAADSHHLQPLHLGHVGSHCKKPRLNRVLASVLIGDKQHSPTSADMAVWKSSTRGEPRCNVEG